jgi:transposase-like protein
VPKRKNRSFTAEQKSAILRRHHVDKVPVSTVCEEAKIQPSQFYLWQRHAFENLAVVLESRRQKPGARERKLREENERLKAKLVRKDHVIAVISEDHVALKKELGEP